MITSRSLSLSALAFAALLPAAVPAVAHAEDARFTVVRDEASRAVALTDPPARTPGRDHESSCGEGTCSASAARPAPRQGAEAQRPNRAPEAQPRPAQRRAPRAGAEANCGEGTCSAHR